MGIQFITDSTSDLSCEYLQEHHIHLIPMIYQLDDREYVDSPFGGENTQTRREFYDAMRAGAHPTTTQINEIAYTEAFESILAAGDDVFFVGFSSGLTGSLNNAFRAREALLEKYPERKIFIVDSLMASLGEGMQIMMAVRAHAEGKTGEEIEAMLNREKLSIHGWFTVDDLAYLKRGGRISPTVAAVGSMLNIKPLLNIDIEGRLVPQEKVKGRKKAVKTLVSHLLEQAGPDFQGEIFLTHSDADEADVNLLRDAVKQQYGRDVTLVTNLTPIIGAHTGPGLLALLYHAPGCAR